MDPLPDSASLATKLRNTLVQYHSIGDSQWRVAKKTKDATVWRKPSEEFSGYLYKAQGVVEDVTNRIVDHIRPGSYRIDWDSLMTSMDIMETFEENCCVMRYTTAGQLWNIIAPREFVDFSYTTSYEDGLLTCGISLDYGETLMCTCTDVRTGSTSFCILKQIIIYSSKSTNGTRCYKLTSLFLLPTL
ncbi:stAR-related lipid transfer protein 4 isoform X2 [Heliangelus exortis]|uniref:stAR-related lipid transfer protein 4 isoform X2 n=1 Tax=Heliangelus exortis TaxID=472823 RepID=UPI003A94C2B6